MKKIVLVTLICLTAMSVWATGSKDKAAGGGKVIFAIQNTAVAAPFEQMFAAYKAKTGIEVELQVLPAGEEYGRLLLTRFATNDYPDAFLMDPGTKQYTKFRVDELYDWTNDPIYNNVLPATKEFQTYQGKIYGVPYGGTNGYGIYYNKDVFAKLGVQPPKNYQDLISILTKAKAAGVIPVYEAARSEWPLQVFTLAGWPSYVDPAIGAAGVTRLELNQLDLADIPALQQVFKMHLDLMNQGYFQDNFKSGTFEEQVEALGSGKTAMVFQISSIIPAMVEMFGRDVIDRTIGFFPLPSATDQGVACLSPANQILVPIHAKNVTGAVELVRFMTQKENLELFYQYNGGIPVYKDVKSDQLQYMQTIAQFDAAGKAAINVQNRLSSSFTDFPKILQTMFNDQNVTAAAQALSEQYKRTGKARALPGF
jgi:raffinose/stachyose/melibiose transport system substrate-binding protein